MYKPVDVVEVRVWGYTVGAVALDPASGFYAFEYDPKWVSRGVELSPIFLGTKGDAGKGSVQFLDLSVETFKRLPAMLADALPDKFGNALIDAALSDEGVPKEAITALDRLAYVGSRGMGALEFKPPRGSRRSSTTALQLSRIVEGARNALEGRFDGDKEAELAIRNILQVGISAGGARAKAVVAWNPETNEIRSGQGKIADGFEHWLIKLDGVGKDLALGTGADYGRIEYAYYLMAKAAGIEMSESRLLEENGRAHFMTKRFDRDGNTRHHLQSLCAMKHLDFNLIGAHSYSQYFETIDALGLGQSALQEGFRRMVFNVAAANHDDHTKNLSFLLKQGQPWALSPAYDITHAYNPENQWTRQHLMSVNGKTLEIERSDLMLVAELFEIPDARNIVDKVAGAVDRWAEFAKAADISIDAADRIGKDFRPIGKSRHG